MQVKGKGKEKYEKPDSWQEVHPLQAEAQQSEQQIKMNITGKDIKNEINTKQDDWGALVISKLKS